MTVLAYGPDRLDEREIDDVSRLAELRGRAPVLWVNVEGLGDADTLTAVAQVFGLHRLALEDVVHTNQRPKLEQYPGLLFLVTHIFHEPDGRGVLETEQVSIFLGEGFVLTFQERSGDCFEQVRQRIREQRTIIRGSGPDYLFYALTDAVIDHFFPIVEALSDRMELIEDDVLDNPQESTLGEIRRAKRQLLTLRRIVWPMRDAVNGLLRENIALIGESTHIYLRDCHDHCLRIIDLAETYRDQLSGLGDAYMSSISHRMNEIMAVLTIIATIFIPLGFIAGVYGMNFDGGVSRWNMPELRWSLGYPFALALMALTAGGMIVYFWRSGWIWSRDRSGSSDDD
ncbi:MAG: magnesium/cobalt transporter CorA [Acidobacteriota bacterium]|nr:magnesium/cobalt transporter CorA [Acidobacteriota bacterium]